MNQEVKQTEKVLAAIPVKLKTGWFSEKEFTLVFTEDRIVFAMVTPVILEQAVTGMAQNSSQEGKESLGGSMAGLKLRLQYYQKYLALNPEMILEENSANFAIPNSKITMVRYKPGEMVRYNDEIDKFEPGKLRIATMFKSYKCQMNGPERGVKDLLQKLYGGRLK